MRDNFASCPKIVCAFQNREQQGLRISIIYNINVNFIENKRMNISLYIYYIIFCGICQKIYQAKC